MKTVLVTGANKGIGYEICRQLLQHDFHVFLTARDKEKGEAATRLLKNNDGQVTFLEMDVSSRESVVNAFNLLKKLTLSLDVLINNAGELFKQDKDILLGDEMLLLRNLQTNAVGPLLTAQVFSSLLKNGSRIINISSGGGSMHDEVGGWAPYYCISKTTLNAITRQLDFSCFIKGVLVNSMCPGWVKTDMGGEGANRTVMHGAETAVWLATAKNIPHGKFIRDKKVIPW